MTDFPFTELAPSDGEQRTIGDGTTVGREGCDVILSDLEVSRRHAAFRVVGSEIAIEDLGSRNGTFVNGRRVEAPTPLAPGDEVRIGGTVWRLERAPAPETRLRERGSSDRPAEAAAPPPAPAVPEVPTGASRGGVPAPPDPNASAVRRTPAVDPSLPPAFESAGPARRTRGSAARSRAATAVAFAIILATAVALAIYFAARDQPGDQSAGADRNRAPSAWTRADPVGAALGPAAAGPYLTPSTIATARAATASRAKAATPV